VVSVSPVPEPSPPGPARHGSLLGAWVSADDASAGDDLARLALDAMREQVCLVDATGTIVYANTAWTAFARDNGGDPACSGVGINYLQVCGTADGDEQQDAQSFQHALLDVLEGRATHRELEYPCHSPTELRWFVASITRLSAHPGARALVVHQPVTDRRLALAQRAQAQRLEMLSALSVGMAHDFNNILGSVLGNAALVELDLGADHPARAALKRIAVAGQRGRELIQRMLAIGRGELQPPSTQLLGPLVEEALTLLRLGLPASVTMEADLSTEALWARVDATDLQQALMNLVTNAWHALQGRAGGRVCVGLTRWDEAQACLWVEDNGVGMSPALRGRIFEPFFTTRAAGEGTGLGLSQVSSALARIGGRADVSSTPGVGSCFRLMLPLAEPQAPPPAEPPAPPGSDACLPRQPQPRPQTATGAPQGRVLLVDDDEVVGMTLSFLLERAGWQVRLFDQPARALQWLDGADVPPDVLVTDQTMPTMSGLELCRAVRQRLPGLPLVLVSGAITPPLQGGTQALGGCALVAKEQAAERLLQALAEVTRPAT
jgi:signal transduction histidine kinase/CheY-like chemotaxis protein